MPGLPHRTRRDTLTLPRAFETARRSDGFFQEAIVYDDESPEWATFTRHHHELPDLVWLYRANDSDEMLYSVRSMSAHIEHRKAWIIGDKPTWWAGGHIPHNTAGDLHANTFAQLRAACLNGNISDPFVLINDDMFVTEPVDSVPVYHCGTVESVVLANKAKRIRGGYATTIAATGDYLKRLGHVEPLCYELHVPMVIHKDPMLEALDHCERHATRIDLGPKRWLNKRTMYGNIAGLGGEQIDDVKVSRKLQERPAGPWLSTNENTFRMFRAQLEQMFPERSRHER